MEATRIKTKWKRPGTNQPSQPTTPPPPPVVESPVIDFLINDLSTPDLTVKVPVPASAPLSIFVRDYKGGGFAKGTNEARAANCFVSINNTLRYYSSMTDKPLKKWSTVSTLLVNPRAAEGLNANYNRKALNFFYANSPQIGGEIFAADSTDIVTHELGHGILDAYRPDMWNAVSLEIAAFHEAFGDFTAMMHIMQYDIVLSLALMQTNSNLNTPSVISKLAEQFGKAISMLEPDHNPDYLRCAVNQFVYVNPANLPADAPDNQLAAECHNFSRVFLGALWDILLMIHEDVKATGVDPITALKAARDILTRYVLKAIQNAPLNVKFYEAIAKTILWVDVTIGERKYHDRIQEIFFQRNILIPQVRVLSNEKSSKKIVKTKGKHCVKMNRVMVSAQSGHNPLLDVEIEIPCESVKLYDNSGRLYDVHHCCDQESFSGAVDMLNFLHNTGSVSGSIDTPFEIKKNKLCRTHMSCCSCRV